MDTQDYHELLSMTAHMRDFSQDQECMRAAPPFLKSIFLTCRVIIEGEREQGRHQFWCFPFVDDLKFVFAFKEAMTPNRTWGISLRHMFSVDRNQGRAGRVMHALCDFAERAELLLFADISADADKPMSTAQLWSWFQQHGFEPIEWVTDSDPVEVVRVPIFRKGSPRDTEEDRLLPSIRKVESKDWMLPMLHYRSLNRDRSATEVQHEFELARNGVVEVLADGTMPYQYCFPNVARRVRDCGGTMVTGWQISGHNLMPGTYGAEMQTHAVWKNPSGQLIDITRSRPGWSFAPSAGVSPYEQAVILAVENRVVQPLQLQYRGIKTILAVNPVSERAPLIEVVTRTAPHRFKKR